MASRWWYTLAAVFIACYVFAAWQLTDNTPKFDDHNDVFGFFKQLALAQTPLQKVGAFFYPNNEHVTAFNHFIYYLQYRLSGEILFYPLTILGHIIIILTGCLLGTIINNQARQPFYFAAITIGYINLYYWDSAFKAMTSLSNQAVILFSVATLFSLLRWKKYWLAIAFALLATFSQGNGMLAWPLGLLALVLQPQEQPGKWRHVSIWVITAIVAAVIYYLARQTYGAPASITTDMVFSRLSQNPSQPVLSLLAFLGSSVFSATRVTLAIVIGMGALLFFVWHAWHYTTGNRQQHALIFLVALFLLASAITASITRGLLVDDASGALESRYKMYSIAFLLLMMVLLCEQCKKTTLVATALMVVAVCINASGYRMVPAIQHQSQAFRDSYRYWLEDGDFRRQAVYFIPMSDHFLFVAEHLKLFDFMQLAADTAIIAPLPAASGRICPETPAPAGHCPMTIRHRGNALFAVIAHAASADNNQQPALPANIILCDEQANVVMEFVIPETANTPENPASQQQWLVPEADIPAGTYRVLFQPATQAACETQLIKKPRKVQTEMRTLFGH